MRNPAVVLTIQNRGGGRVMKETAGLREVASGKQDGRVGGAGRGALCR